MSDIGYPPGAVFVRSAIARTLAPIATPAVALTVVSVLGGAA